MDPHLLPVIENNSENVLSRLPWQQSSTCLGLETFDWPKEFAAVNRYKLHEHELASLG